MADGPTACIDARLLISPKTLGELLQLPPGWRCVGLLEPDAEDDPRLLYVGVAFPDGPSDLQPLDVAGRYTRVIADGEPAIRLDGIVAATVAPARRPAAYHRLTRAARSQHDEA